MPQYAWATQAPEREGLDVWSESTWAVPERGGSRGLDLVSGARRYRLDRRGGSWAAFGPGQILIAGGGRPPDRDRRSDQPALRQSTLADRPESMRGSTQ